MLVRTRKNICIRIHSPTHPHTCTRSCQNEIIQIYTRARLAGESAQHTGAESDYALSDKTAKQAVNNGVSSKPNLKILRLLSNIPHAQSEIVTPGYDPATGRRDDRTTEGIRFLTVFPRVPRRMVAFEVASQPGSAINPQTKPKNQSWTHTSTNSFQNTRNSISTV